MELAVSGTELSSLFLGSTSEIRPVGQESFVEVPR